MERATLPGMPGGFLLAARCFCQRYIPSFPHKGRSSQPITDKHCFFFLFSHISYSYTDRISSMESIVNMQKSILVLCTWFYMRGGLSSPIQKVAVGRILRLRPKTGRKNQNSKITAAHFWLWTRCGKRAEVCLGCTATLKPKGAGCSVGKSQSEVDDRSRFADRTPMLPT